MAVSPADARGGAGKGASRPGRRWRLELAAGSAVQYAAAEPPAAPLAPRTNGGGCLRITYFADLLCAVCDVVLD